MTRNIVLDGKDVLQGSVISLGPEMGAGGDLDELDRYTDLLPRLADAALDEVGGAEGLADRAHVHALVSEGKGRVAGNHEELPEAGELVMMSSVMPSLK